MKSSASWVRRVNQETCQDEDATQNSPRLAAWLIISSKPGRTAPFFHADSVSRVTCPGLIVMPLSVGERLEVAELPLVRLLVAAGGGPSWISAWRGGGYAAHSTGGRGSGRCVVRRLRAVGDGGAVTACDGHVRSVTL